ncbi:PAX-interacting protein 1-like [Oppia nitens]|uniref:PAX-interacting protein 1-like n=1 Tax=Oppia nitens TaxID=1686743 RepID=UPI0023DB626B|nr:PAX-interacting protein 1-like [Oppia nitens]
MTSLEEEVSKHNIFREVQFSLCEDVNQFENVKKLLLSGGAKFFNYLSDNVTHLIGDNADHHFVSEAVEIYEITVVTSRWVWLSAKASLLLPTAGFSPFKNQLFSNIIACPSNISGIDAQTLWAMITYYGGSFRLQLEPNCTHLISTKPEGLKYNKAVETKDEIKIVTPDWVIDSVKNKALCDEDLYHPRLLIFNNQSFISAKLELTDTSTHSLSTTTTTVTSIPLTSSTPQLALRTVSLPTTAMITTFSIAPPLQASPTSVQGGRVRVFLPPQHQVRLMQMKQNQIRQLGQGVAPQQQVVQMIQRHPYALSQHSQQQQQQQLQQSDPNQPLDPNQQWNTNQQMIVQTSQTGAQNTYTTQPIQVISQNSTDLTKLRPINTTLMAGQQPRQVYLAVQQTRHQHFIGMSQQSQQRQPSNILIQQRGPNVQSVRLQQGQQHLIQLQQRQPISLQSAPYVRTPQQHIIIQQQNQQAIQRQLQIQQQPQQQVLQSNQSQPNQTQIVPQIQQRMTAPRIPQQFIQQNQIRGQPIRGPLAQQQIISSAIQTGQPRVYMKGQQYAIQGPPQPQQQQQQFDPQTQTQHQQQFIRAQTPPGQMQFIRGPQWLSQDQQVIQQQHPQQQPQPQQHLVSMRPQHILVTQSPQPSQPTQQQIIQWQQQEIQRRQLQQHQIQQRFPLSAGVTPDKVRPIVSVVSVSSSANTDSGATAATSTSTVRNAQTPQTISPNIVLSNSQTIPNTNTISLSAQVNPVSTSNTTPTTVTSPIVNPKTKTALANMLNNRLQSGITNPITTRGDGTTTSNNGSPTSVSISGSLSLSSSTSLTNKTGFGFIGSPGVAMGSNIKSDDSQANQLMQIRFYAYEPNVQIPNQRCLLGCVFHLYGFENLVEKKLIDLWISKLIKMGAEVETTYTLKCTHVLCDNTNSPFIQKCIEDGKRCVTVYWINEVMATKKMFPPIKFYHLPHSFGDIKPCKNHIITMSNFEGEERLRIKEMILKTGAKYTSYLTQKNSVIICKRLEGNKYKKAVEWRLAIVNTLWLHDVLFGQLEPLQLSSIHKKYQNFDSKTPLRIEYSTVQQMMNPWRQPVRVSEDVLKSGIAEINEQKQDKKDTNGESDTNNNATTTTTTTTNNNNNNNNNNENTIDDNNINSSTANNSNINNNSCNNMDDNKKEDDEKKRSFEDNREEPLNKKPKVENEINNTPLTPLTPIAPMTPIVQMPPISIKEENIFNNLLPAIPLPTLQINPETNKNIKVMFTSIKDLSRKELRSIVISLGGRVTNNSNDCTHLVTDRIVRTVKFLCAFGSCKFIVTCDWVRESGKQHKFVDENDYKLSDLTAEKQFGFSLEHSLSIRSDQIFNSHVFYITNGCIPSPKVLKEIIESNGGQAVITKRPTKRQLQRMQENGLKFLVISCENDLHLCDIFHVREVDVMNVEFILSGILKQELDFELYAFKHNILKDNQI